MDLPRPGSVHPAPGVGPVEGLQSGTDGRTLENVIRPESGQAVDKFHALGAHVVMTAGDARPVAGAVGSMLDVAEVLTEDKDRPQGQRDDQGEGGAIKKVNAEIDHCGQPASAGRTAAAP